MLRQIVLLAFMGLPRLWVENISRHIVARRAFLYDCEQREQRGNRKA